MSTPFMRPNLRLGHRRIEVDVPQLILCSSIALFAVWLLSSAWSSAADVENLILILPISVLTFILFPFTAASAFRTVATDDDARAVDSFDRKPLARNIAIKIVASMALLFATAVLGPLIGFDIALPIYVAAMMALLGERRIHVLILVPLIFTGLVIYLFNILLAAPLPLGLLHGIGL